MAAQKTCKTCKKSHYASFAACPFCPAVKAPAAPDAIAGPRVQPDFGDSDLDETGEHASLTDAGEVPPDSRPQP